MLLVVVDVFCATLNVLPQKKGKTKDDFPLNLYVSLLCVLICSVWQNTFNIHIYNDANQPFTQGVRAGSIHRYIDIEIFYGVVVFYAFTRICTRILLFSLLTFTIQLFLCTFAIGRERGHNDFNVVVLYTYHTELFTHS